MHPEVVCHGAAHENTCSNADVPSREVGAVCRATLVVAGEVHAHGLVAREDKPEACADEECGCEERYRTVAKGKKKIGDNIQGHAGADKVYQVASVNQAARHDAVHDKPCGNKWFANCGTARVRKKRSSESGAQIFFSRGFTLSVCTSTSPIMQRAMEIAKTIVSPNAS